jgi:hypothetical protein
MEITRPSNDSQQQQSGSSPETKKQHNKLKKREAGGGGAFRKMFGRNKNRQSMAPPPQVTNGQASLQAGGGGLGRKLSNLRKKSPTPTPAAQPSPKAEPVSQRISEDDNNITPIASPHQDYERSYDPSVQSLSRVDTNDAHEANQAFSNFDQGPLDDVPAFIPDSPRESEDDAAPPDIARARDSEDGAPLTKEVTGDRWAQIRKNAAERAAQRQSEEQSRGGYSAKTDGDDGETSGEESMYFKIYMRFGRELMRIAIESRVARIKARVAELTGNMETTGAPVSPVRR